MPGGCREIRVAMPLQVGPNRITLCFPRDPTAMERWVMKGMSIALLALIATCIGSAVSAGTAYTQGFVHCAPDPVPSIPR
jgi:hypothetical protein